MYYWVIKELGTGFEIVDSREPDHRLGVITPPRNGKDVWEVHFVHNDELDFEWDNIDVCIGYARGIERYQALLASITV